VKAKTCQYCCYAKEASADNRTILICDHKQAPQAKFFVVAPDETCRNFKPSQNPSLPDTDGGKLIPLTKGKFAVVDPEDYPRLAKYKWSVSQSRYNFYACRCARGKKISMHRLILNAPQGLLVDHIDGDGLNNRKANLRLCTIAQNNRNSRPYRNATSKYKGVCWEKQCRKWYAKIRPNRKTISLGLFTNQIDAAVAYDRKAEQLFGQFAYLNFPDLPEFRRHAHRVVFGGQTKQARIREIQKVVTGI